MILSIFIDAHTVMDNDDYHGDGNVRHDYATTNIFLQRFLYHQYEPLLTKQVHQIKIPISEASDKISGSPNGKIWLRRL